MRTSWLRFAALLLALSAACVGCAFFNKSDPVVLRYFTPEAIGARPDPTGDARVVTATRLNLRIGRVNAASYVKDRIAFRDKSFEIGYYENLRWTEKPEAYLRRALTRALFEENGVRQIISGPGPTLDVDLDAFEELRFPRHAARMQVTWDKPGGHEGIAAAMAEAFDESVKRVVAEVLVSVAKITSPASPPGVAGALAGTPPVSAAPTASSLLLP